MIITIKEVLKSNDPTIIKVIYIAFSIILPILTYIFFKIRTKHNSNLGI